MEALTLLLKDRHMLLTLSKHEEATGLHMAPVAFTPKLQLVLKPESAGKQPTVPPFSIKCLNIYKIINSRATFLKCIFNTLLEPNFHFSSSDNGTGFDTTRGRHQEKMDSFCPVLM